jgi:hypothetical protein
VIATLCCCSCDDAIVMNISPHWDVHDALAWHRFWCKGWVTVTVDEMWVKQSDGSMKYQLLSVRPHNPPL